MPKKSLGRTSQGRPTVWAKNLEQAKQKIRAMYPMHVIKGSEVIQSQYAFDLYLRRRRPRRRA